MGIIDVKNIKKCYKNNEVVKGISFNVDEKEVFGFLGPNGAGKSTTIKMLCTMLKPTDGTAIINGYDIKNSKNNVRESIGVVFQETALDEKLTAYENLHFNCKIYNIPKEYRKNRIEEVLKIVDLQDRKKDKVSAFSGGMKRRLEIARALINYPKVLFLDEPTVGLDPQTRANIWEYVLKLKEQHGITIFLTTHYMDEAEYCDRIAIIDNGEIIELNTPEELKNKIGRDVIEIETEDNKKAKEMLINDYKKCVEENGNIIRFHVDSGKEFLASFIRDFKIPIKRINLRQPSLNDVFLELTGKNIRE